MVSRVARRCHLALGVAIIMVLSGCFTGERPRLVEGASSTGDPAADAVLSRLEAAGQTTYTGDYTVLTRFGSITTPVTVVQTGPARRAVTVGDVRFIVDGPQTSTC